MQAVLTNDMIQYDLVNYDSYLDIRSLDDDHYKIIILAQFKDWSKHFSEGYPESKIIAGLC